MPNYCNNYLTIRGPKKARDKFRKENADPKDIEQVLSFEQSVPLPKDCQNVTEIWGTKWDAEGPFINNDTETELCYSFSSAWDPPDVWLDKVSRLYPSLEFELAYDEEGNGYRGEIISKNGCTENKRMSHHEYHYKNNNEYAAAYDDLMGKPYEEFLKEVLDWTEDEVNDLDYPALADEAFKRIKDTDLPLFIGKDWIDINKLDKRLKEMT